MGQAVQSVDVEDKRSIEIETKNGGCQIFIPDRLLGNGTIHAMFHKSKDGDVVIMLNAVEGLPEYIVVKSGE